MQSSKVFLSTMVLAVALPMIGAAQGMMIGGGAGMPNGTGMVVVASDGSILVTQMGMSMMGGPAAGSAPTLQRAVVDIGPDGTQRWRTTFADGWPMMAANNGDLVVVVLVNNAWMWRSMSNYGWFPWGGNGAPVTNTNATLVGLDLATGSQRWSTPLPGDMASYPEFSADGARIYVSLTDFGEAAAMGTGPVSQGDAGGWATQMTNKVVALNRSGSVLWTVDLSSSGGMMGGAGGMH